MSGSASTSLVSDAECALCGRVLSTGGLCAECARGLPSTMFEPPSRAAGPLREGEVVLLQTREKDSPDRLSPDMPLVFLILAIITPFALSYLISITLEIFVFFATLVVILLVVTVGCAVGSLRRGRRRITVTNRRTIYEQGLFRGRVIELAYQPTLTATAEPTASGCPTLVIDTGLRGHIIPDLRCAERVCRLINALVVETVPAPTSARASSAPPPLPPLR